MTTEIASDRPWVAFYAPMKSPNHPTPSGDRRIARLTLDALHLAGFDPVVVSDFRSLDMKGSAEDQKAFAQDARQERERLVREYAKTPPALWFTYHCYYKAPDLLGPDLADAFDIPYAISEPSISPSRRVGPWSEFAQASEAAIERADKLFWTTARDRPALEQAGHASKMVQLKAFVEDTKATVTPIAPEAPVQLLTVAMMRPGDKFESYRRLAEALVHLDTDWRLTIIGDGSERERVEALFARFGDRVLFTGQVDSTVAIAQAFRDAHLFVWPGVGEGVGMVYLEAQMAGLPVVAENHPAASELVAGACTAPKNAQAFADRILQLSIRDAHLKASHQARGHVSNHHSLEAASQILRANLKTVLQ